MTGLEGVTLNDRYYLRQKVGKGGMADVYLAWDQLRSTKMAVKVLRPGGSDSERRYETFDNEADLLRKLEHPYIVRLYEFNHSGELIFLVMDWIEGTDLRRAIKDRGAPYPPGEVTRILKPLSSALNFAHQMGIYHCDIKPANILLHVDGRVLLSDFGVARLASDTEGGGTPQYMAPEQILDRKLDARTDIYSLGITTYEMLSGGNLPFRGQSSSSQGSTVRKRIEWEQCYLPLPPLTEYNPNLPESLLRIIEKALSKDMRMRYTSTIQYAEAFERAAPLTTPSPADIRPDTKPSTPTRATPPLPIPHTPAPAPRPSAPPSGNVLIGRAGEWAGRSIQIPKNGLAIGRSSKNHLQLQERSVSRAHAMLIPGRKGVYIRDEKSSLGTYVNDRRIAGPQLLRSGDQIRIGMNQVFEYRGK